MTFSKILSLIVLSIFLFSGVSAVTSYASWENDELQSIEIENGNTVDFSVDFFAMIPPTNARVELYDSSDELIYTFLNQNVETKEYTATYTLDRSIYGNVGNFAVIVNGVDAFSSQSHEITLTVTPDVTAPTLSLNGANPQYVIRGDSYIDAGVSAIDSVDGDLSSEVVVDSSEISINTIGTYTVYYSVSDTAGNTATATRIVNVVAEGTDFIFPTIIISSPAEGSIYNSLTHNLVFVATDENLNSCSYSPDNGITIIPIECNSGELNSILLIASEGANTWIVYASDESGNEAEESISFSVDLGAEDTTAPAITIISPEENETLETRNLYVEVATDEDATVTLQLDEETTQTMENDEDHIFNYSLSGLENGEHTITFTATDTAGNIGTETVTFEVQRISSKNSRKLIVASNPIESEEKLILPQGEIILLDEKSQTEEVSFFQSIINAIVEFFKKLFGMK